MFLKRHTYILRKSEGIEYIYIKSIFIYILYETFIQYSLCFKHYSIILIYNEILSLNYIIIIFPYFNLNI